MSPHLPGSISRCLFRPLTPIFLCAVVSHEDGMAPGLIFGVRPLTRHSRRSMFLMYLPPTRHAERPRVGLFFFRGDHAPEPAVKRTVAFIDGQNLFHAARGA